MSPWEYARVARVFRISVGQISLLGLFREVFSLNSAVYFRPSPVSSQMDSAFRPRGQAVTAPSGSVLDLSSVEPRSLGLEGFSLRRGAVDGDVECERVLVPGKTDEPLRRVGPVHQDRPGRVFLALVQGSFNTQDNV
jgi:hypothetical protein